LVGQPEGGRPVGRSRRNGMIKCTGSERNSMGRLDWIDLAEDRDKWRALLNRIIKNSGLHKIQVLF
jgi:hypothetical protein